LRIASISAAGSSRAISRVSEHKRAQFRRRCAAAALAVVAAQSGLNGAAAIGASLTGASARSPMAVLGRHIFFDAALSGSGRISCAACHSPEHAYGPPNGLAVQLGGAQVDLQGARAVPSLRYVLNRTPVWNKTFVADPVERLMEANEPPSGGFGWDGRFNTLHEQAAFPLLAPNEMANAGPDEVVAKLQRAPYAESFRLLFGADIFANPRLAFARALEAVERFELEDASFHPYSSRYDDYLDGKVQLSERERRGLALFDDPKNGNCAQCHIDRRGADGSHPLFTDFQFQALGVPRNPELRANREPAYADEGLCGPLRLDQIKQIQYCGMFKTPTLRNVATRSVFFHNGRFHLLREALEFYVQRDTDPARWYPKDQSGAVNKFDDSPLGHKKNVDTVDPPLTRAAGARPAWNDGDIDDVLAFLETLTDRDARRAAVFVVTRYQVFSSFADAQR
jgi:cytochrome c peroxidase